MHLNWKTRSKSRIAKIFKIIFNTIDSQILILDLMREDFSDLTLVWLWCDFVVTPESESALHLSRNQSNECQSAQTLPQTMTDDTIGSVCRHSEERIKCVSFELYDPCIIPTKPLISPIASILFIALTAVDYNCFIMSFLSVDSLHSFVSLVSFTTRHAVVVRNRIRR